MGMSPWNLHGWVFEGPANITFVYDVLFEEGRGIFRQKHPQKPNKEYQERMAAMQASSSASSQSSGTRSA